jgi:hypothetical protein
VAGLVDGGIQDRLVLDDPLALDAAGRGDDDLRERVIDADRELMGREPAKDHRVHRPDPRARQHGDDGLGDHRHVDDDAVALGHPEPAEHPGEPGGLVAQFSISERPACTGHR